MSIPISQFIPPPLLSPGNHKFVSYICDSTSVLSVCLFSFEVQKMIPVSGMGYLRLHGTEGLPHSFHTIGAFSIAECSA